MGLFDRLKGRHEEHASTRAAGVPADTVKTTLKDISDMVRDRENHPGIMDARFTDIGGELGKWIFDTVYIGGAPVKEMTDDCLEDLIDRDRCKGMLTAQLADDTLDAKRLGNLKKFLTVTQNAPLDGCSFDASLTEPGFNLDSVDIVKLGKVIK